MTEVVDTRQINIESEVVADPLQDVSKLVDEFTVVSRKLLKELKPLLREYGKLKTKGSKRKRDSNQDGKRPSGFSIPVPLTDAACDFLKVERGTLMARTDVTKKVIAYIKGENPSGETLQDADSPRFINLNDTLCNLFNIPENAETETRRTTWFNLQKLMTVCYVPKVAKTAHTEKTSPATNATQAQDHQDNDAPESVPTTTTAPPPIKRKTLKKK